MKKFVPFADIVLVRRHEESSAGPGNGLSRPDSGKEEPSEGTVLEVGPGRRTDEGTLIPMSANPGDHIIFGKYAGKPLTLNGEDFLYMREAEIIGTYNAVSK